MRQWISRLTVRPICRYLEGMEAFRATLSGPFEESIERVKDVFQEHGFGTLSEIDVRKILREKLGIEIEPYTILGVCNPGLASKAIATEPDIGVFLPCTVLVRARSDKVCVVAQDPIEMVQMTENLDLMPIALEAHERIAKAVAALG